jgi:outer membrane protein assembly factor BamB
LKPPLKQAALSALGLAAALLGGPARAENWPQFRGPESSGVSQEERVPLEWSSTRNVRWKVEIPGLGWSSPVVWGDRVFVTTAVGSAEAEKEPPKKGLYLGGKRPPRPETTYRWEILCLERASGKTLWQEVAVERKPLTAIQPKDSYASSTPLADGERVYAYFGASGLYGYDFAGKPVWKKDLGSFKTMHGWASSSPALEGERLFVLCDHEGRSFLLALDRKRGEELWRVERDEKSSWGTPFVWRSPAGTELVTCGSKLVRSYEPASGKLLWSLGGMSIGVCTTPVAGQGLLFVSSGGYVFGDFKKPLLAVRPGGTGELKPAEGGGAGIAWQRSLAGPYIPSPLFYRGSIYVLYDQGFFACFDAATGKPVYSKQRLEEGSGAFTASPWACDGKVFCLSEDGDTFVIQAGPEYKLLGKNSLEEMCMASPAVSGGCLFIRGRKHLYSIGP